MLNFLKRLLGAADLPARTVTDTPMSSRRETSIDEREGVAYTTRNGRPTSVDQAFTAWTSGDLDSMIVAAGTKTNLVDRHFLLQGIVNETYKRRIDPTMRDICQAYASVHLKEFAKIAPALRRECDGVLPRVLTFQHYATLLNELGRFEDAVEVCRTAIAFNLEDGTKSGFEGRITRILKARNDS